MTLTSINAIASYVRQTLYTADFRVSMFQIPEPCRVGLVQASAKDATTGKKKSINACILDAIEDYFEMGGEQPAPELPKLPLRQFTVRMPDHMKQHLMKTAAEWQIRLGVPITMNAVVNTAIVVYLKKNIPDFSLPES